MYFERLITLVCICLLSCKKSGKDDLKTEQDKLPNIIFLLADDQRADAIGFMGNTSVVTPHFDSLAKNGIVFQNAYVTTSICAVSRASILTGQYARRHDIWGFSKNLTKTQLDNTYPLILRQNGYTTAFIGKYGVGNHLPIEEFDYWRGFSGQGSFNAKDTEGNAIHLTKKISNQIIEFLDSQKTAKQPFCLSVSFKAPHVEGDPGYFLPDEAFSELHKNDSLDIPMTSAEAYFDHFPKKFTENNVARKRWQSRFSNPEMQQENIKKYYRLIHGIDNAVGNLVAKLKSSGQLSNTVIIYSSDNGFYLGEYGFAGKWYGSEPSIRVPLLIFDGRHHLNSTLKRQDIALNIDIAPTILGLADVSMPAGMQGKDLLSKPLVARTSFFYEHLWQSSSSYYIPSTEGIIQGNTKYMRYFKDRDTTAIIFEELYNLEKDPFETDNLIDNTKSQALISELKSAFYREKNRAK